MTQQEKAVRIVELLEERYPTALCALHYEGEPWKLLVMGRLSAQCTDYRVNLVCKELFARFPTCEALAKGELTEIESLVRPGRLPIFCWAIFTGFPPSWPIRTASAFQSGWV